MVPSVAVRTASRARAREANPDHLRANIAAAEIAENLTDAEVARLTGLVDESKAVIDQPHQSTLEAHRSAAESHR